MEWGVGARGVSGPATLLCSVFLCCVLCSYVALCVPIMRSVFLYCVLCSVFLADPNAGIRMELVLKRRIMNAVLTVYLPTLLILTIVYATNFFKDFFFEAVVTVNLTALLVLTTLFISVSKSLPPTAYVKMIDVWLIFSQLIPFAEVKIETIANFNQKVKR